MLRFTDFNGANRQLHPLRVPQGVGVDSLNQRPGRADLRPWRLPAAVATVPALTQTIYRMGRDVPSDSTYWLSWSVDVDIARSLTADDTTERTFWTGDGPPKWTDNTIALSAAPYPTLSRVLGVPAPTAAATVDVTGGSGTTGTRYYVWTWVTDKGEESAPSPVSAAITGPSDATYSIEFDDTIPEQRGINRKRLYRTTNGTSGDTAFYFIVEVASSTSTFDDIESTPVEPLPSLTWLEPPATMRGLRPLWNGMMAGFVGKSIRFCDPYRPFAWPIQYELIVDDAIVALAVYQQNLVVLTTGRPYLITGSTPESMTLQPLEIDQSCIAKRSVVEFGHGIVWASPDGLVYTGANLGATGARVITAGLLLRDDWTALIPSSVIGERYEGAYICSYNDGLSRKALLIDPLEPRSLYFVSTGFDAAYQDPITDSLYVLNGTTVSKWDASASSMTATFKSRTELRPSPQCYSFGRVIADAYPVSLTIVADGVTRLTKSVTSDASFRLPAGYLADKWRIEVSTTNPTQAVLLANSAEDLRQV